MLNRRLLSAAIIISLMLAVLWADYRLPMWGWNTPGLLIILITAIAQMIAAGELVEMWKRDGRAASYRVAITGTALMTFGASLPIWYPGSFTSTTLGLFGGTFLGLFASICLATIYEIVWFEQGKQGLARFVHHVFIFGYMALIAGSIPFHRLLFGDNGFGLCAVIAVIACVKLSDATAYAIGKLFGKHRLAARISAGKTIEGAAGAFLGGIGGAVIMFMVITPLVAGNAHQPGLFWMIGYGIFLTVFGILGDLAESIIKREAHCKDSSAWVPGLGGILDIIDSLTFAAPASCLYWVLFS